MSSYKSPFIMLSSSVMITSSLMAISSSNWMFLWAGMELNLLSFIPLLMNSKKFQEAEAAVKYFLAQALGSSILLMSSMSMWFNMSISMNLFSIFLIMSILLKLGMAPLHLWYPSVMSSISWMSCFILSTWQKLAPLMILSFITTNMYSKLFMLLASMNAIIGGVMGMNQTQLRTIMAYSSITHMGWMMGLLYIVKPMYTIMYFTMYSFIILPIFMIFHFKSMLSTSSSMMKTITQSSKLQYILPLLFLSLAGLPPFTGFIPKWMTITALASISPLLVIMLIMGAMMNTYYYLNILFNLYLSRISSKMSIPSNFSLTINIPSSSSIILLFLLPILFIY